MTNLKKDFEKTVESWKNISPEITEYFKKHIKGLNNLIKKLNKELTQLEIFEKLIFLSEQPNESAHNNSITDDEKLFLKLIGDGLIKPNGKESKLTQRGKDLLKELKKK